MSHNIFFTSLCSSVRSMATPSISESLWREAFGAEKRPTLYSSTKAQKNDFASLASPKSFMKDLESLSHTQLYVLAENSQLALKAAQEEYLHIERLIRRLEQKDSPTKPQNLLDLDRFEEEKEATLYGYKRIPRGMPYTRTKDGTEFYGFQEPFSQGGFVPTDAQYKRMKANAKVPNNIDGWTPIERDGKNLIPRMPRSPPPRQRGFTGTLTRPSHKRRLVEQGFSDTDAAATFSDSDAFDTPSKHVTRFMGRKIPPTRDPSETPASVRGSPTPHRQHKFVMNNLTQALMSASASTRPSTNSTPALHETSPTPSSSNKRRRITHQSHQPRFNATTNPHSSPSHCDPEEKKWTDVSLISAISTDHSFLHPDPAIALSWRNAIWDAPNPVRSYAMKRKWAWWKKGGMDKRPRRGWREGTGEGDESQENEVPDRLGSRIKLENGKVSGFKTKDDEQQQGDNYEPPLLDSGSQAPPPPPPKKQKSAETNEPTEAKQSLATKQQKDRQFTFKIDYPPPPPPHLASLRMKVSPSSLPLPLPLPPRLSLTHQRSQPPPPSN